MGALADEIAATRTAIHRWALPAEFLAMETDDLNRWRRLRDSVVSNCDEGLSLAMQLGRAGHTSEGFDVVARVQRRWARWLRQVRERVAHPRDLEQDINLVDDVNAVMVQHYDTVASGIASAARAGLGVGVLVVAVLVALAAARR